ncbi:MAG: hypothetical protein IJ806_00915 [Ruminococcus sp.]|nr:hypothetical protein [Ruminococcus sp.]
MVNDEVITEILVQRFVRGKTYKTISNDISQKFIVKESYIDPSTGKTRYKKSTYKITRQKVSEICRYYKNDRIYILEEYYTNKNGKPADPEYRWNRVKKWVLKSLYSPETDMPKAITKRYKDLELYYGYDVQEKIERYGYDSAGKVTPHTLCEWFDIINGDPKKTNYFVMVPYSTLRRYMLEKHPELLSNCKRAKNKLTAH